MFKVPGVVLAAGMGSRFTGGKFPKPLVSFLGLTLLERSVLTLSRVGLEEIYVVVGFMGNLVRDHAREISGKYGIDLVVVENSDWALGNGTSVLSVSDHVRDRRFLLTMCDHFFELDIVRSFLERSLPLGLPCLSVDRRISNVFDIDDATKVLMDESGKIVSIGKDIENYNAIDMGLFLVGPEFLDALKDVRREKNHCSVTDGVRKLSQNSSFLGIEVRDGFWIDIDTQKSMDYAKSVVLSRLSKDDDGLVSKNINRKISSKITERLVERDISPNTVSVASFLLCIFSALAFSTGGYLSGLLGGVLAQLSSIIDGCDGEIARLKFLSSPFGGWFDTLLDRYGDASLVAGITCGEYGLDLGVKPLLLALLTMLGFVLVSYARKEYSIRFGKSFPMNFLQRLGRRDLRIFVIFLGSLVGSVFKFMVAVGIFSHLLIILMMFDIVRSG